MTEPITFKNADGTELSGILHAADGDNAAIIAHGFTSSKDRPRFSRLADMLIDASITAFRFDFGGCGESEERPITVHAQVKDLEAAIALVRRRYRNIMLIGHSLGGLTALSCPEGITTMVLWAPVTQAKIPTLFLDEKKRQELEEKGEVIFRRQGRSYRIPHEYFEERTALDSEKLLNNVRCPILIIHGDGDHTVPIEHSSAAVEKLPEGSRLDVVHAGHDLDEDMDQVLARTVEWCKHADME